MELLNGLQYLSALDALALALFFVGWIVVGWYVENPRKNHPSVSVLMEEYRRDWMRNHVTRNPRVFDAMILGNLRNGITFFASGCMLAIGGVLALLGNTDPLLGVAADLSLDSAPKIVWELKLLFLILMLTSSFLKFVWSHRLFGYASVLMGAIPNDESDSKSFDRAELTARVTNNASRNFNRGLRALYFSMASLAWLLGSIPLLVAVVVTISVVWRREFASLSRGHLIAGTKS